MAGFVAVVFVVLMFIGVYVLADRIGDEELTSLRRKRLEEKAALRSLRRVASLASALPTTGQLLTARLAAKKAQHTADLAAWDQALGAVLPAADSGGVVAQQDTPAGWPPLRPAGGGTAAALPFA